MSNENRALMCAKCGSPHIEERVWSRVNRGITMHGQEIDAGPFTIVDESDTNYWCPVCEEILEAQDQLRWSNQEYCKECDSWYEEKEMHPTEPMCKYCAEEI